MCASFSHSWNLGCFCRSERLQHSLPQSNTSTACWSYQQALEEASGKAARLHLQGRRWFWGRKWVFSQFTLLWGNFGCSGHCWWCFGTRTSSIQEFLWCTQAESHYFVRQKSNNRLLHKTTDGNAPCWVFWSPQGSFLWFPLCTVHTRLAVGLQTDRMLSCRSSKMRCRPYPWFPQTLPS